MAETGATATATASWFPSRATLVRIGLFGTATATAALAVGYVLSEKAAADPQQGELDEQQFGTEGVVEEVRAFEGEAGDQPLGGLLSTGARLLGGNALGGLAGAGAAISDGYEFINNTWALEGANSLLDKRADLADEQRQFNKRIDKYDAAKSVVETGVDQFLSDLVPDDAPPLVGDFVAGVGDTIKALATANIEQVKLWDTAATSIRAEIPPEDLARLDEAAALLSDPKALNAATNKAVTESVAKTNAAAAASVAKTNADVQASVAKTNAAVASSNASIKASFDASLAQTAASVAKTNAAIVAAFTPKPPKPAPPPAPNPKSAPQPPPKPASRKPSKPPSPKSKPKSKPKTRKRGGK
jgi:hypothetical protein